ncbi:hypothetical protein AURDEDRAFT_68049 [Auricularia subglabra TFB-10046 SS5]|nr:hypothetical protein AURDEDRAFT_68049 [Auricularia subglabra TFB-10046 SS5]
MDGASTVSESNSGNAKPPPPPALFSLRWNDPSLEQAKRQWWKAMLLGTGLTTVVVLAVLSIYWGAFWRAPAHAHNLRVAVVDLDQAAIGQAVVSTFTSAAVTGAQEQLSYEIAPPGAFADEQQIIRHVTSERVWAAIVVAQGASTRLERAVQSADASYNSSRAIRVFFERARNENAIPTYIITQTQNALNQFAERFAQQHAQGLAANGSVDLAKLLTSAPNLVTQPAGFHLVDLHPFDVPVAAAVDFVGLIYLLVISFLVAINSFNARLPLGFDRRLAYPTLLKLRVFSALGCYFFISWAYCLISLFFQVPFSRFHGRGGFVIYWAISYLGMCALGLVLESMLTLLTMRFNPFFMILWIILNVSVSFFPIELLPRIFRYGYAMPFYHVGRAVRTLVFGTKSYLGLNFGVLIAWIVVAITSLSLALLLTRRRDEAAHRRQLSKAP